jgi:hypothetical protein
MFQGIRTHVALKKTSPNTRKHVSKHKEACYQATEKQKVTKHLKTFYQAPEYILPITRKLYQGLDNL